MTASIAIPLDDVPRVARALVLAETWAQRELAPYQRAVIAHALLEGHTVVRSDVADQMRAIGVLVLAEDQSRGYHAREHTVLKLAADFVSALRAVLAPVDRPPTAGPDPRREAIRALRIAGHHFEGGTAPLSAVTAAYEQLRDVVSRQCCERDRDLDGNCDVHREKWKPRV